MFNDDGLGAAMEASANRDAAKRANDRIDELTRDFVSALQAMNLMNEAMVEMEERIKRLEWEAAKKS